DTAACLDNVRFTPKADMCGATRYVRFVPKADMLSYSITSSVGARRENRKGAEGEWQHQFIAHAPV
ncbi:MAG: hypothetical protein WCB61_16565, partial [Pseudolabrys sp.]